MNLNFGDVVYLLDALLLKEVKGVGDTTIVKLLKFSIENQINTIEELVLSINKCTTLKRIPKSLYQLLDTDAYKNIRNLLENKINDWEKSKITIIHLGSNQYPKKLLSLDSPPPFLFCKGDISLLNAEKSIAVVGTRENSARGAAITEKTVKAFGSRGFSIISGLALGIDTIAHRTALNNDIKTISVLVDIENVLPKTNILLAKEILDKKGLLISENPPGVSVIPGLFVKRDRIQSGLAAGVFVIETSKNGGSMHAARQSRHINRLVFTPDPHAAKYHDLSLREIEGTQDLLESGIAESYTKQSYDSIAIKLNEISEKINSKDEIYEHTQGNLLL